MHPRDLVADTTDPGHGPSVRVPRPRLRTTSVLDPVDLAHVPEPVTPERLAHAANHDDLTGLPNRAHTLRRLQQALDLVAGGTDRLTLFFVDLDHFKLVNDSLGHAAGDVLLRRFAQRLQQCAEADAIVGRLGGDEFVVVCRHASGERALLGERLMAVMNEPIEVGERRLRMTASVGAATSQPLERRPDRLLQAADTALFEAKRLGRGRVQWFTEELHRRVVDRVELEAALRVALDQGQLRLEYQPQIDLRTGLTVGVEALLRWRHPTRGEIGPDVFVPIAEDAGLIGEVGSWVARTACTQLASWQRRGDGPGHVTINVSPLQLDDESFAGRLADELARHHLDPSMLGIEITESALMGRDAGIHTLAAIRELGCYVGIDDFGTGHSSLARLRHLPVEVLKIDRSFVDGLGTDPHDSAIVASIMSMAIAMGLHVIAEGVEHERQADALVRLGCRHAQGFLFARPMAPQRIPDLMGRRLWRPPSPDASATRAPGIVARVLGRDRERRAHRRFVHEFLEQIGVPIDADASVESDLVAALHHRAGEHRLVRRRHDQDAR